MMCRKELYNKHNLEYKNAKNDMFVIIKKNYPILPVDLEKLVKSNEVVTEKSIDKHIQPFILSRQDANELFQIADIEFISEQMYHKERIHQIHKLMA